jgi:type I restriction enzyme S subunit
VEWKTLGEIGTFIRGNGIQKKDFTETGTGCIHYGQIHTHYGVFTDKTISFIEPSFAKRLKKAQKGDLIIATTSEDIAGVCKAVAWLGENEIAISGDSYIFKHKQNPKYISYLFQTDRFYEYKMKYATGTKVIRVSSDSMEKFLFPIPPLSEQERIVAILDKFNALINDISIGLPAEIAALQKKYEYYRNKLLTFKQMETI